MNAVLIATLLIFNNQNNWNHGISPEDIRFYFDDFQEEIEFKPPGFTEVDLIDYI
jgi:hypothetical protein